MADWHIEDSEKGRPHLAVHVMGLPEVCINIDGSDEETKKEACRSLLTTDGDIRFRERHTIYKGL